MCRLTNRLLTFALFCLLLLPTLAYGQTLAASLSENLYKPLKNSDLICEFVSAKPTNNDFIVWRRKKNEAQGKKLGTGPEAFLQIKKKLAALKTSKANPTKQRQLTADKKAISLCSKRAKDCRGPACDQSGAGDVAAPSYVLTFNIAGNGTGLTLPRAAGQLTYPAGATATFLAVSNANSIFTGWTGALSGTQSPITLIMDSNKSVTANFTLQSPPSSLPLVLTGSVPENKTMILNLVGIPQSVAYIDLTFSVYDADRADEGQLYVNGQAVATLFGAHALPVNDNQVVTLPPIRVPAALFQTGDNFLTFLHLNSAGFRIEGLSMAYIAALSNTPTPSRTPTASITRTGTATPSRTPTALASRTSTVTPTRTPSRTPSRTPTNVQTLSATRTYTPSPTRSRTPTATSTPTPTSGTAGCVNGIKDGNELGVDCGGSCAFECPSSHILGIDVTLNGTPGKDYAVEWLYHDPRVDDSKVIYLKDSVQIGLVHTSRNRMQSHLEGEMTLIGLNGADGVSDPTITQCLANWPNNLEQCDAGMIRYKIDRSEQGLQYALDGMSDADNSGRTPYFTTPFSLSTLRFQPENLPVLGRVGNNGQAYYNIVDTHGARPKYNNRAEVRRTNFGQIDEFGDEWHTLTFWDDDSAWNTGFALGASDGAIVRLVVNPKTPVIRFKSQSATAQYYTTPAQTYFVPAVFRQVTYLSTGVEISFQNVTNSDPIWYRINNAAWQRYTTPLQAQSIFSPNTTYDLHYVYQAGDPNFGITRAVKKRSMHYEPAYPSANETHPSKFLWDSSRMLDIIKNRITRPPYRSGYEGLETGTSSDIASIFSGFRFKEYEMAKAFNSAFISFINGSYGSMALNAKKMLLDSPWMHEAPGIELRGNIDSSTPNRFALFYYQGNANEVMDGLLAYDTLIGTFKKSNGYSDGFTAIEDYKVRDSFAAVAKNALQFHSAHLQFFEDFDPQGGIVHTHYLLSGEIAAALAAMTMPTYDTHYFGTSGYDSRAATHPWTPFPNYPETWWFAATNETPQTLLHDNPDRSTPSHLEIFLLAKNAERIPNNNYFTTYYGTNMERVIPNFVNILHNANAPLNLTNVNWKIGDYMLCRQTNRCLWDGDVIYDSRTEYRSMWSINKHFDFAKAQWDAMGGSSFFTPSPNGFPMTSIYTLSFYDDTLAACYDRVKNNYEDGVDCGGSCPNAC